MPNNGKPFPGPRASSPASKAEKAVGPGEISEKRAGGTLAIPGSNGRHLDLDRFVPYRLSVLTNRVSNAIARTYSERFGLSVPEWRVTAVLGQASGLSAGEVARRTEMDKVQVSRAVAGLVRSRRVQKHSDSSDGRVTRLALTARGRSIYDEIVPHALELEEELLAALEAKERKALNSLLAKLSRHAIQLQEKMARGDAEPRKENHNEAARQ